MDILKVITSGESHGPGILGVISGVPGGLPLSPGDIMPYLERRRNAPGRSERMQAEGDECEIISGVRAGFTLGSPIAILVPNRSKEPWNAPPALYPRPGHADWPGVLKRGLRDIRDVWERASARATVGLVSVGAVAARALGELGIRVGSWVERIGDIPARVPEDPSEAWKAAARSPVATPDPDAEAQILSAIKTAQQRGTTLGGAFRVAGFGLPPGLGDYVEFSRRLDARIAGALMSIPSVKAVEIGEGIAQSRAEGKEVLDEFSVQDSEITRTSNLSGGLEGGMTNGQPLLVRCFVKPVPTQQEPLASFNIETRQPGPAMTARGDVCVVPAAAVIAECVLALVLLDELIAKFGGDSMKELSSRLSEYRQEI